MSGAPVHHKALGQGFLLPGTCIFPFPTLHGLFPVKMLSQLFPPCGF